VGRVKRLLILLGVALGVALGVGVGVALGVASYRRLSGSRGAVTSPRAHRHGTPDHWPPILRKPGSREDSTTSAA
jgi:hypothetical protein